MFRSIILNAATRKPRICNDQLTRHAMKGNCNSQAGQVTTPSILVPQYSNITPQRTLNELATINKKR
jgi:hypothetical protein